ncbi:MAG: hypothetical protein C5S40_01860 [ANME-2 cluster archaeon]|nr:hypothetical protein [ANME-2 cluster archaeon]
MGQGGVRAEVGGMSSRTPDFTNAQILGIAMDAHLLELILIFFILTK